MKGKERERDERERESERQRESFSDYAVQKRKYTKADRVSVCSRQF